MTAWRDTELRDLVRDVQQGTRSAVDITSEALAEIDAQDEELGAFLHVDHEGALARARGLDQRIAAGDSPGPLAGVPVALKANLCLEGLPSCCGSRILEGWRAPYTATAVEGLLEAGAVPVGMTNMDEFAMGSSSENSAFGPSHNPWDPARTPGGSSSGSAVAVASGMVPLALGSDTGGSVRQPAALTGTVGFKPTYGRVSRYGLVAFGSSLDQISPFARSVRDLEVGLAAVSGPDERDSTCLDLPPIDVEWHSESLEGIRIGVPDEGLSEGLDDAVRARFEEALEVLTAAGATATRLSLPSLQHALSTYYVVATAEASSNLARYDGVRYGLRDAGDGSLGGMIAASRAKGFGREVERRILLGTYVLSSGYYDAWYGRALGVRRKIAQDFELAFADVDVIATPTSPIPAFPLGERTADPLAMYLADVLTVPASLAGLPAISVPCGFVEEQGRSLPVGLQLTGRPLEDARVLRIAALFEDRTDFRRLPPRAGVGAGDSAPGA